MKSLRFLLSVALMSLSTLAFAQSDAHKSSEAPPQSDAQKSFDSWLEWLDEQFSNKDVTHRSKVVRDVLHDIYLGRPYAPPSIDEPRSVAEAAKRMGLRHVVVTCVTRDDLDDGGEAQFALTIAALREALPDAAVEVLTSDFRGNFESVRTVVEARPDYFNHNVETVPRLYDFVRPGSRFERSLAILREAKRIDPTIITKSGLMLGLGERRAEVIDVLRRLHDSHVEIVTIGQYLQPKREKLDVVEYIAPSVFDEYRSIGEEIGFRAVFSGPFVRSSYMADAVAHEAAHA